MIEEPVPTMPERVPAISPTARTKSKFKGCYLPSRGTSLSMAEGYIEEGKGQGSRLS